MLISNNSVACTCYELNRILNVTRDFMLPTSCKQDTFSLRLEAILIYALLLLLLLFSSSSSSSVILSLASAAVELTRNKLNSVVILLGISEIFLCSLSALQAKCVLLRDARQLLMLLVGTEIFKTKALSLSHISYCQS
jgi:hypothetical protein